MWTANQSLDAKFTDNWFVCWHEIDGLAYTLAAYGGRSISVVIGPDSDYRSTTFTGIARMASNLPKNMVLASFGAAGLVAVLSILDIVTKFPFAGSLTMDILFLLSSAIVGYLAWDSYKDLT